jgi:PKD repeat protein
MTDGFAPLTVNFDSSTSRDPDGDPMTFTWDFADGATASGGAHSHTFVNGGIYIVKLTARDNRGGSDVHYGMVTVNSNNPANTRPVANAVASRSAGFAPVTTTVSAAGSTDADGDALTYEWMLIGPGVEQISTGPTQTITLTQPGNYLFQVGVEDGRGGANRSAVSIVVRNPADPACKMVVEDFTGTYLAEIFLSNYGTTPINGWQVWWQFPAGTSVFSPFNVTLTGSNPYVATPASFNSTIQPGGWVSFGFMGFKSAGVNVQTEVMGNICDNRTPPPGG